MILRVCWWQLQSGLEAPEKGSVAMRLLAEEAGQIIVSLNVTWLHNDHESLLTNSITIQVGF